MLCVRLQIRRLHLCLKPTVIYVFDLDVVFKRAIVIRKGDMGISTACPLLIHVVDCQVVRF